MDWVPIAVSAVSAVVALLSWATSARKSRVDNLNQIIDAQADWIKALETELREAQAKLAKAETRIEILEDENCFYRRVIAAEEIDLAHYEAQRACPGNGT
jgi:phage shock protein A